MENYTDLKRRYDLRETLIKAQSEKIKETKKRAEIAEKTVENIILHRRSYNWLQRLAIRVFRLDSKDLQEARDDTL